MEHRECPALVDLVALHETALARSVSARRPKASAGHGTRRFGAYHDLQGAFGRRALTERAKGILMERYQVDERRAFAMLRDFSRTHGLKIIRVAQAVVDGDLLRKPRE